MESNHKECKTSSCVKFGVRFGNKSTLLTVDSCASLPDIMNITLSKLQLHGADPANYCFLYIDEGNNSATYITEENRGLMVNDVIDLVKSPLFAAKHAVDRIRFELQKIRWDESQCQTLFGLLKEWTIFLHSSHFANEFVRAGGHEAVFRLVESFFYAEQVKQTVTEQHYSVWSILMACLAELSEYGIGNAYVEGDALGGEVSVNCGSSDASENLCPVFNPNMRELFSWHLVSDRFLDALIRKCLTECDLNILKNQLKIILKLLSHCSTCVEKVAIRTESKFIFSLLQRVHDRTAEPGSGHGEFVSVQLPWQCNSAQDANVLSFSYFEPICSPESVLLPEWAFNSSRNELMCFLLGCMLAILSHSHRTGRLSMVLPDYLNSQTIPKLVLYFPQMKIPHRPLLEEIIAKRLSGDRSHTDSNVSLVGARLEGPSHGSSNFFFQTAVSPQEQKKVSDELFYFLATNNFLYNIQRLQFALIANELTTLIHQEKSSVVEQIRHLLLQYCSSDRTYLPMINEQLEPLQSSNHATPFTRMHLRCLRSFLFFTIGLLPQMLSYGYDKSHGRTTIRYTTGKLFSSYFETEDCDDTIERCSSTITLKCYKCTHEDIGDTALYSSTLVKEQSDKLHFPLLRAVTSVCHLLCEVFSIDGHVEYTNFQDTLRSESDLKHFYPMFFSPRALELSAFEDIFISSLCVFFDNWTRLNAHSCDFDQILRVLHEQLFYAVSRNPISVSHFDQLLRQHSLQAVRAKWNLTDQKTCGEMQSSHPFIKDLKLYLEKCHRDHVNEQRINAIVYSTPLEYVPQKTQKLSGRESQKYFVYYSPDKKALVAFDEKNSIHDLWPLICIERVSTGVEERVKKNPERTIVLRLLTRETSEQEERGFALSSQTAKTHNNQILLLAGNSTEYNYWLDGLHILQLIHKPSKQYMEDVQSLSTLDLKLRLAGLDLSLLPTRPRMIPPDPPEFDFPEP